jgi:hypothetical protein
VRDTLIWLGQADSMGTMEIARQRDPKRQEKAEVLTQWWAAIGDRPVTARELIACAEEQDTPQRSAGLHRRQCSLRHPDLHEAWLGVAGGRGKLDSNKLGYWLRGIKDQMVAGFQIVEADIKHKTAVWQLIRKQLETTE